MEKFVIRPNGEKELYDRKRIEDIISLVYMYRQSPELFEGVKTKAGMLSKLENEKIDIFTTMEINFVVNIIEERVFKLEKKENYGYKETINEITLTELRSTIESVLENSEDLIEPYKKLQKQFENDELTSSHFFNDIMSALSALNTENSNANVDEHSFGGRKFRASGELQKFIALEMMISPNIKRCYLENKLYIHDLDSYAIGQHNCMFVDLEDVLTRGFVTRNGDVRKASGIETAYQLVAVIFQIQSQVQFGGVGTPAFDAQMAPFVANTFKKLFIEEVKNHNYYSPNTLYVPEKLMKLVHDLDEVDTTSVTIESSRIKLLPKILRQPIANAVYREVYVKTLEKLYEVMKQSSEALVHNLNTLESRPGSQLPFTSANIGYDTTPEGRLVSKFLMEALIDGIGKYHKTSIFPQWGHYRVIYK